jgi:hypothetical protein
MGKMIPNPQHYSNIPILQQSRGYKLRSRLSLLKQLQFEEQLYSFSPHSLQYIESARFSLPQVGQDLVRGMSATDFPQRGQNLAPGVRFLWQPVH